MSLESNTKEIGEKRVRIKLTFFYQLETVTLKRREK